MNIKNKFIAALLFVSVLLFTGCGLKTPPVYSQSGMDGVPVGNNNITESGC